jgi:hypothetical protein
MIKLIGNKHVHFTGEHVMACVKIESKTRKLTRELIKKFAEMAHLAADDKRDRPARRAMLRKELHEGRFHTPAWAYCFCKETNTEMRLDGQGSSKMLNDEEPELYAGMEVHIDFFECDTKQDVIDKYATYNRKESGRQNAVIDAAVKEGIPELCAVPDWLISLVVSTIAYVDNGNQKYYSEDRTQLERASELKIPANIDFAKWLHNLLISAGEAGYQHLKKVAVFGAMLTIYRRSKEDCETFFTLVRDGEGLKAEYPERRLNKFLANTTSSERVAKKTESEENEKKVKRVLQEIHYTCLGYFVRWREGNHKEFRYKVGMENPITYASSPEIKQKHARSAKAVEKKAQRNMGGN